VKFPVVLRRHAIIQPRFNDSSYHRPAPSADSDVSAVCLEMPLAERALQCHSIPGCICKLRELQLNVDHRAVLPIMWPDMLVALCKTAGVLVDVRNENLQNCACCIPNSHLTNR
jgi:hypothetical protein